MKTGFQNSIKKSAENRHPFYEILGPFWGPFGSGHAVLSPLFYKCVLHVGTREAGYIKMGPKIDEVWVLKSMIFVIFFDRCFGDFMFNFVSWPGRPDKRRVHTEHTQRQPNRKEPKWLCEVYGNSQKDQHSRAQHNTAKQSRAQQSTKEHKRAQRSTAQHSRAQHNRAGAPLGHPLERN